MASGGQTYTIRYSRKGGKMKLTRPVLYPGETFVGEKFVKGGPGSGRHKEGGSKYSSQGAEEAHREFSQSGAGKTLAANGWEHVRTDEHNHVYENPKLDTAEEHHTLAISRDDHSWSHSVNGWQAVHSSNRTSGDRVRNDTSLINHVR